MSQQYEAIFQIFPFKDKGVARSFNLLWCSRTSHESFTNADSLVEVSLTNAHSVLPTENERERKWQLKGGGTLSINMETGMVAIDGEPALEPLEFRIVRADLNRV